MVTAAAAAAGAGARVEAAAAVVAGPVAANRTDPGVLGSAASLTAFATNRGDRGVVGVADNVERTERAAIFGVTMVNNIQKGGG